MEVEKGVKGELKDVRGEDESGTRGVIVAYWFGGLDCCRSCWALKKTECAAKDAEEGSDIGRREGCCGPADDRGRTAWEDVGKVQRVAEEGSDARGSEGCCGPAVWWGGMMWEEVG